MMIIKNNLKYIKVMHIISAVMCKIHFQYVITRNGSKARDKVFQEVAIAVDLLVRKTKRTSSYEATRYYMYAVL